MAITCKSPAELEKMWAANQVVCRTLDEIGRMVAPGVTTGEIGALAGELVRRYRVKSAFLGYGQPPFPSVACVSVNDEVVHGIPSPKRVLSDGDVVSVDFGVEREGYFGDSARTFAVGAISADAQRLLRVTEESLECAIEACVVGQRVRDISRAVQTHVEANGFSVVRVFVGHGIGRRMHEDPPVPNYVSDGRNPRLKEGMVLAIEPMVNAGQPEVELDRDRWTARTRDGTLSAHFEHSVAITRAGPWVLSRYDGRFETKEAGHEGPRFSSQNL
ncbi:MAG: type I methionyl aminopeptidase [Proteobacteria bacterium]|nr:type I methionyl aminopeptidase [Pseudomonadota bacterium]